MTPELARESPTSPATRRTPKQEWYAMVEDRKEVLGRALSLVRKCHREQLPVYATILASKSCAEQLASALGHLADLYRAE